jgi:di/tricarboxylate transporter
VAGLLALAVLLIAWLVPPPAGLSVPGWRALGTVLALVPVLALDALPEGVLALLLPAVWVLGGVAPPGAALAGYASPSFVLVVAILALGAAVASSGLLYRLALGAVERAPGGFAGQAVALGVAGVLVGPAMPNATGRVALLAPALTEMVEALGYAPRSRPAAGLAMAALAGFGQMAAAFLTSSTTAVLVFAVLPAASRANLDWTTWALRAAPVSVVLLATMLAAIVWLYRPRDAAERGTGDRTGALALQRALLGPPTREERAALAVAGALVLGFATQPLHRADPAWVAVLALGALAAAGAVTAETLRTVNWSFALLFGMLASLAEVLASTGADGWLAALVAGAAGDLARGPATFVAALAALAGAVSFLLRWQAAAPLLTITLAPVAGAAGLDPFVVGLVVVVAGNGFFLPYQSTIYLALYHGTEGRLFTHAQARPAALAYGLAALLALLLAVPAWRAMGLL